MITVLVSLWVMVFLTARRSGALNPATIASVLAAGSATHFCYLFLPGTLDVWHNQVTAARRGVDPELVVPTLLAMTVMCLVPFLVSMSERKLDHKRTSDLERRLVQAMTDNRLLILALVSTALALYQGMEFLLDRPLLPFFSRFLYMLSALLAFFQMSLAVMCFNNNKMNLFWWFVPSTVFWLFFGLSSYSRSTSGAVLVAALVIAIDPKMKYDLKYYARVTFVSVLGFWCYLYATHGRPDRRFGMSVHHIFLNMATTPFTLDRVLKGPIAYTMSGGQIYAACIARPQPHYSIEYAIGSMIPFPAFIMPFPLEQQVRVHKFIPFSGIAEAVYFGWPFTLILLAVYWICLRWMCRSYITVGRLPGMIASVLGVAGLAILYQYPVRNGFRQFIIGGILSYLLCRYAAKKAKTVEPQGQPSVASVVS